MFARSGARGLILSISLAVLGASPDHEVWAQLRALARVHPNREAVSRTADLYDPSAGTLSAVPASEAEARTGHTATLLQDGKVLFAGGYDGGYLDGAHLYDPS